MSDMNPKPIEIEFDGKTYGVTFNINVIDDVQTHFNKPLGDIYSLLTDEVNVCGNIRYILTSLLNDAIEAQEYATGEKLTNLTEHEVGRKINIDNFQYYQGKIFEAFGVSMPDIAEDEDSPNAMSEQQS